MSDALITRAALGRMAAIGDLYDVRTDALCGISIFKTNVPEDALKVQDSDFLDFHLMHSDTFSEKFSKLDVKAELQVSVLAGLFKLEGSGRYFKDKKQSARTLKSSLLYNIHTKDEHLNIYHEDLEGAFAIDAIESGVATHVVVGISWGANTVLSCTCENKENRDVTEIGGSLKAHLEKASLAISGGASVDFTEGDNENGVHFDVRIYGDILPKNEDLPTTFESALALMKQVPSLVSDCNDGKGKPLTLRLIPISQLQDYLSFSIKADTMLQTLEDASLIRVVQLFDEMSAAQQELNDFHQDALDHKFCVMEEDMLTISGMKNQLVIEETSLRSQLSSLLTEVRSGTKGVQDLEDLIQQFYSSEASSQNIAAFLASWGSLNEKISFAKTLVKIGAKYIGYGCSLDDEILKEFDSKTFVFFFTQNSKSQDPSRLAGNRQIFFQELKKKDDDCKYFAVDCDIHSDLLPQDTTSCIQVLREGKIIHEDLLDHQMMTSAVPLAQSVSGAKRTKNKPNNRVPLVIPCTGNNCDPDNYHEWTCKKCSKIIEYGFNDIVYCNCGATPAALLEFKCTDPKHGVAFERHDDEYFAELIAKLRPFKELNILILGETGVGKSTWINGFVNFLTYESLEEAEDAELTTLIPSEFTIFSENFEKITVISGSDNNEVHQAGQSATQDARVYPFQIGNTTVKLIDTPGIGDTRGIEQDKKNFQNILGTLSYLKEIHGICILLKPNNARVTVMFRFCIKELLTYLHRDASKNIVFCFTNSRGTFYRPGDTMPALQALLEENKEVEIVVSPHTVYCFDSEAYRFLAAVKNDPPVSFADDERENFSRSWTKSITETKRMLEHIESLPPHPIQNTLNLNHTRELVLKLTKPLAEINRNIQTNKTIMEREMDDIKKTKEDIKELKKMQWTERTEIEVTQLDYPKTVCSNSACVKIWSAGVNNVTTTEYVQVCHNRCFITGVKVDSIGDPQLMGCSAIDNGYCRHDTCRHHYREHLHIYYDSKQVLKPVENNSVMESINQNLDAAEMKRKMIEEKNTNIEELEEERKEIECATVKFAYFLKTNAITPYNDGMEKYLDHLIREEDDKVQAGGRNEILENLKLNKESYNIQKSILDEAMQKGEGTAPTASEVMQMVDMLKKLKHNGKSLEDALECVNYTGKQVYRETVSKTPPSAQVGTKGKNERKKKKGFLEHLIFW